MIKRFSHKKRRTRNAIFYLLASIAFLSIVIPYLVPVSLQSIPNSTLVYDRNGIVIGEILPDGIHRHQDLDLTMYPSFLVNSIIAIEDQHFREHNGIDIAAVVRSTIQNIKSDSLVQ